MARRGDRDREALTYPRRMSEETLSDWERLSMDGDHVLADLREKFDETLAELES
jgi:hypothetical protein